jgi:hypothetical protein
MMVNFKTLRSVLLILGSVALLSACNQSQSNSSTVSMEHFDRTGSLSTNKYTMIYDDKIVTGAGYDHTTSGMSTAYDYRIAVSFSPIATVTIASASSERGNTVYIYDGKGTPASIKAFWDVMYEYAKEDAEIQGYTVAEPLVAIDHVSVEDYESQIAVLTARIQTLEAAEAELKTRNVQSETALAAVQSEKDILAKQLANVTTQRDVYKAYVDDIKSSAPNF